MKSNHNSIPGTSSYRGTDTGRGATWSHLHYSESHLVDRSGDAAPSLPTEDRVVDWYDWRGLGDEPGLATFAETLGVPPLALEDARDIRQRPKYEERPDSALLVLPFLCFDPIGRSLLREHVTLYWSDRFLLSIQEFPDELFAGVRQRIKEGGGRVRKRDSDYLAYALADVVIDGYGDVIAGLEPLADALENDILLGVRLSAAKREIHELKQLTHQLRAVVAPARDAVSKWQRSERVSENTGLTPFLVDLADNLARLQDLTEGLSNRSSDLYQLYSSEVAVGTNQVVQVLTVVSAIFIPLTFLTGLYGMNFQHIPELSFRYGYYVLWAVMISLTLGLLLYFKRRGWL